MVYSFGRMEAALHGEFRSLFNVLGYVKGKKQKKRKTKE
jgi:hypothetical protein